MKSTCARAVATLGCVVFLVSCASGGGETTGSPTPDAETTTVATPAPTVTAAPSPTPAPTATAEPPPTATPEPTSTPTPTATPEPTATAVIPSEPLFEVQGVLPLTTQQVNEMILFVESETGRPFIDQPQIVVQSAESFVAGLTPVSASDEDRQSAEITGRRMQALGFTTQGVAGLTDVLAGSISQLAGAYYDGSEDLVYMPADTYSQSLFAQILVHELVHALDDQYVDLRNDPVWEEAIATGNYEQGNVWRYVVEGRASAVEDAWDWPRNWAVAEPFQARPIEETAEVARSGSLPYALVEEFRFPYRFGPAFIRAGGGAAGTWDLLEEPPVTTEEILAPGSAGDTVISVETPDADGPILETGYVGAHDLGVIFIGRAPMASVARGWAGGAWVMWGDDSTTCIRIAVATDSIQDRDRLAATFARWVDAADDRSVQVEDELVVATACAPLIP